MSARFRAFGRFQCAFGTKRRGVQPTFISRKRIAARLSGGLCSFWLTRSRSLCTLIDQVEARAVPPECPLGYFGLDNEDAPARPFLEMLRDALFSLLPVLLSVFFRHSSDTPKKAALTYSYLAPLQRTTIRSGAHSRFYLRVSINLVNRAASSARPERELQRRARGAGKRWFIATKGISRAPLRYFSRPELDSRSQICVA